METKERRKRMSGSPCPREPGHDQQHGETKCAALVGPGGVAVLDRSDGQRWGATPSQR